MLSDAQMRKLKKGQIVQIKHRDIMWVANNLDLNQHTYGNLLRAYNRGSGVRIQLDQDELVGNGFIGSLKKNAKKAMKVAKQIDDVSERVTGERLSNHAKAKAKDYIDFKIGKDNRKGLEKMYNTGRQMYDSYHEETEGGNIFNQIKKGINKSNKTIEKGFNKHINARTIKKGLKQVNNGLKSGLRTAGRVTDALGLDNPTDILVDEALGRVVTPFAGATASNVLGNKIKGSLHSAGYGVNPYLPPELQGGSFRTQGGSFKTQGGSFVTQGGSVKHFPNTRIRQNNFI